MEKLSLATAGAGCVQGPWELGGTWLEQGSLVGESLT